MCNSKRYRVGYVIPRDKGEDFGTMSLHILCFLRVGYEIEKSMKKRIKINITMKMELYPALGIRNPMGVIL